MPRVAPPPVLKKGKHGGSRNGSGRPGRKPGSLTTARSSTKARAGLANIESLANIPSLPPASTGTPIPADLYNYGENLTPLAYALAVINDPTAHPTRRDAMAAIAMPFVHPKPSSTETKKSSKLTLNFNGVSAPTVQGPKPVQIEGEVEPPADPPGKGWSDLLSSGRQAN